MLEIAIDPDKQNITAACKEAGQIYSEAFYLFRAADRGASLGYVLFEVLSNCVKVVCYHGEEDHFLFDGLLRAGFHYAEKQGIEEGLIPDAFHEQYRSFFERLNYPAMPQFNIVNFFTKYKNCAL